MFSVTLSELNTSCLWAKACISRRLHFLPSHLFTSSAIGTYVLRDDLHLATPPPHPSEAPITSTNPLATTPAPATAGVKLSLAALGPRKSVPQLYKLNTSTSIRSNWKTYSIKESEKETRTSGDNGSDVDRQHFTNGNAHSRTPAFGEGNPLLMAANHKDNLKRRKPKNNIVKSNSSFISRVIAHDALTKRLQERGSEGIFAFTNINRAFQWLDLTSALKVFFQGALVSVSKCCVGRTHDEDPFHQGSYIMPRCERLDEELKSYRRNHGLFICRYPLV